MEHHELEVAITGPEASPDLVPVHVLAEILSSLERALTSLIEARTGCAQEDCPRLSLVGVHPGSEVLAFAVPQALLPSVVEISRSLAAARFEGLPRSTYAELVRLSQTVERRKWRFEIRGQPKLGVFAAAFGRDAPLPPPPEPPRIRGTTAIHGVCLRVGGATSPKAEVRLTSTRDILYVDLSEDLARELARRLYEEVMLDGLATWDTESWKIEAFRVTSIRAYEPGDPEQAFKELAEAAGDRWEDVDAASFVRGLRAE